MIHTHEIPKLAIGHTTLESANVPASVALLAELGARTVLERTRFAIVELRGGTHIVIRGVDHAPRAATFDLMVDDIEGLHAKLVEHGCGPTDVRSGGVHRSFDARDPGGALLTFTSSHAVGAI